MNKEVEDKIREKVDLLKKQKVLAFGPYDPVVWLYPDEAIELLKALDDTRAESDRRRKDMNHQIDITLEKCDEIDELTIERDALRSELESLKGNACLSNLSFEELKDGSILLKRQKSFCDELKEKIRLSRKDSEYMAGVSSVINFIEKEVENFHYSDIYTGVENKAALVKWLRENFKEKR